jgi:hypothetical protein
VLFFPRSRVSKNLRLCRLHHVTTGRKVERLCNFDTTKLRLFLYFTEESIAKSNPIKSINGNKVEERNQIILFFPRPSRSKDHIICLQLWDLNIFVCGMGGMLSLDRTERMETF